MPQPRQLELANRIVRLREDGETFAGIGRLTGLSRQRVHRIWVRRQAELDNEPPWAESVARINGERPSVTVDTLIRSMPDGVE